MQKGWPEARQFRKSIRLEFSLYVSGLILILMLVTGYVVTGQYVDTVTRNVVDNLLVQARSSVDTEEQYELYGRVQEIVVPTRSGLKGFG